MRAIVPIGLAAGVAGAFASVAVAGCMLVTGGTDGYEPGDAAVVGTVLNSDTCGCDPSSDLVCCFTTATPSNGECLKSCGIASVQLCKTDSECGLNGPCVTETCVFPNGTLTAYTCGVTPFFCAPADAAAPTTD
jgi:hypothetical protein